MRLIYKTFCDNYRKKQNRKIKEQIEPEYCDEEETGFLTDKSAM